jgi:probable rRNA maturation factor
MTSSGKPTVAVEFNLQDVFFLGRVRESAIKEESPISLSTWSHWFQTWLESLRADLREADAYELSLRLTDDREIQALNAEYRHQDRATDVLAFAALEAQGAHELGNLASSEPLYLGDIVISVETAARQAHEHGYSLTRELAWLATHGLLHLLGWDHPDESHLLKMLHQQDILLETVGFEDRGE